MTLVYMKLFSFPVFLISFSIGVLIVYLTNADPREIMVYPTPENVEDLLYRDKSDTCYQFIPNEVSCPSDNTLIKKVMPQTH